MPPRLLYTKEKSRLVVQLDGFKNKTILHDYCTKNKYNGQQGGIKLIAAAYARYSTEHQCSIEVQLYKIKQYCIENDLELPENYIYYDEAVSGMLRNSGMDSKNYYRLHGTKKLTVSCFMILHVVPEMWKIG